MSGKQQNPGKQAQDAKSTPMTKEAASRIQSSQEKNLRDTGSKSFAARAQSTADKREYQQKSYSGQNQQ